MSSSRRAVLTAGAGLAAALAGCAGQAAPESNAGDGTGDTDGTERVQLLDETLTVPEDEYWYGSFSLERPRRFEYEFVVREGPRIDV